MTDGEADVVTDALPYEVVMGRPLPDFADYSIVSATAYEMTDETIRRVMP